MHEQKKVLVQAKEGVQLPSYGSMLASGADIRAHIESPVVLKSQKSLIVPTGLFLEIPPGYEIQVRSRSGLAAKHQVVVLNSPGTIDADYRGELKVILMNHGENDFLIEPNMRIAQIVLAEVVQIAFEEKESLSASERGKGGFGHTGLQ